MNLLNPSLRLLPLQRVCVLLFAFLVLTISRAFAQPQVISLSPAAANAGSAVVITGTGFSSIPSENIVWFGPVRAIVLNAGPNSLTVSVPTGSGFQRVTVSVNNLTGASPMAFTTTFAGCPNVGADFYNPKTDINTGSNPVGTTAADVDGDGQVDLIFCSVGAFSVYSNTSTPGNLSFTPRIDIPADVNNAGSRFICNDINGDGKTDILFFRNFPSGLLVFLNTSTPGNPSFAAPITTTLNFSISAVAVGDLDADGKPDLVVGSSNISQLFILKNNSAGAVPSFATPTSLSVGILAAKGVVIDDFNKDGKPDIATVASNWEMDSVFVFTNNSSSGSISFLPRLKFDNGYALDGTGLVSGDMDRDGFADLAIVNYNASTVSLFMNTGTGTINFRNRVELSVSGMYPRTIIMADINGDALPDIATGEPLYGQVSVFRNMSSSGIFLFAPRVDFTTPRSVWEIISTDLDGDGKTDLIGGNQSASSISIFRTASSQRQTFLVDASKSNSTPLGLCDVTTQDWNNACNNLQAVINAASPGDRVWVAAGTYYPSVDASGNTNPADPSTKTFTIKNGISLYGGFRGVETALEQRLPSGQSVCILNGNINSSGNTVNVNTVVSFSNCDSTTGLSDFTVTGGSASVNHPGGGFRLLRSFPFIGNCIISQHTAAGRGAAFYLEDSNPTIVNCRISGNTAKYGAAADMVRSDAKIINCTIAKNTADTAAGLLLEEGSAPFIANSILWGNIGNAGKQDNIAPLSGAIVSYSMIAQASGVYPGAGNMNANPIFADALNNNFSPVPGSPAIGTGSIAAYPTNGPKTDLLGYPVPNQVTISIGAYQSAVPMQLNSAKILYVNQSSASVFSTGLSWNDAFSNLNDALAVSNATGSIKEVWVAKGTYTPTHGLAGIPVAGTSKYMEATFLVKQIKMYGGFAGNETSVDQRNINGNTTLLDGFVPDNGGYRLAHVVRTRGTQNVMVDGFSIARGSGDGFYGGGSLLAEYNPIVINNCKIFDNRRSGALWLFQAPATVTNTEFWDNNAGNGGAVYMTGATVSITNCYFHDNITLPPSYPMNAGGAVYNAAATVYITNTRFERNAVDNQGAGIYSSNSPYDSARTFVKNCWFTGNSAKEGSAVYNLSGRMSLTNCAVSKNNQYFSEGYGAVYTYSGKLDITNCTITNNTGNQAGGIVADGVPDFPSSTSIKNSIIWGNKSIEEPVRANLFNRWTRYNLQWFTANNSDIELASGNFPGAGNLNSDPKLSDTASLSLNLLTGSTCINTGNNASYNGNLAADTTLEGIARLVGDSVDIGAMEYGAARISNGLPNTCISYSPVTIDATNNNSWVLLTDADGNLVAEIKANGNNLGIVDFSLFVRNGAPREDASGRMYLNRNVIINPTVQPVTPVDIRIYLTRGEYETLRVAVNSKGIGSGIDSINDIAFYKNEGSLCQEAVQSASSIVPVSGKLYADGYVLTATIPSFSAFYMAAIAQSALPLSLLSFSGSQVSGNIKLNWVTTNEQNTYLFSIEKSSDGNHFESIGKLQTRNTSGENNYSFIDTAAFSSSVVYYRLRHIDLDGKFVYSHVISIHGLNTTKHTVTVFPNPISDIIQLRLNLAVRQQVEWTITDNAGRTVQRGKIDAPAGIFKTAVVPHSLGNGIYYLVLKGSKFDQKIKLVKVD